MSDLDDLLVEHLDFKDSIQQNFSDFMLNPPKPRSIQEIHAMYRVERKRVLQHFEYLLHKYHRRGNAAQMRLNDYRKEELCLVQEIYKALQCV